MIPTRSDKIAGAATSLPSNDKFPLLISETKLRTRPGPRINANRRNVLTTKKVTICGWFFCFRDLLIDSLLYTCGNS
jgi:hypothetical protein